MDQNSWEANAVHISAELKRLAEGQESLVEEMKQIHIDIVMLKLKASLWGAAAGSIPTIVAVVYMILKTRGV